MSGVGVAIFKFELTPGEKIVLDLKSGAEILHVGIQHGSVRMWVKQDLSQKTIDRRYFQVYPTGHIGYMPEGAKHLGTAITENGFFVWHVFEIT